MCINIYNVIKRLRLCHLHCSNICCFQYYYPLPQRELVFLCPVLGPPRYGVLVSAAPTCIGVPLLRLQSYHHHMCHSIFVLVCPY